MADQDDFEIDIYGDDDPEYIRPPAKQVAAVITQHNELPSAPAALDGTSMSEAASQIKTEQGEEIKVEETERDTGTSQAQYAQQQQTPDNLKRSQSATPSIHTALQDQSGIHQQSQTDPNATPALRLSELQWWHTEDDIRAWASKCNTEAELREVTFNEFKVNGKSKG